MAKKSSPAVNQEAPAQAQAKKFTIDKLRENCRQLFGVSTSTFVGATYGLTGTFTVAEMKAHIDKWAKEGVK